MCILYYVWYLYLPTFYNTLYSRIAALGRISIQKSHKLQFSYREDVNLFIYSIEQLNKSKRHTLSFSSFLYSIRTLKSCTFVRWLQFFFLLIVPGIVHRVFHFSRNYTFQFSPKHFIANDKLVDSFFYQWNVLVIGKHLNNIDWLCSYLYIIGAENYQPAK